MRQISVLVARGLNYNQVAEAVGICRDTFSAWQSEFSDFSDSLKKAKALGIARRLERIEKAAMDGHWQADAWWLERVCRDQFARQVEVKADIAGSLDHKKGEFDYAGFEKLQREMFGLAQGNGSEVSPIGAEDKTPV